MEPGCLRGGCVFESGNLCALAVIFYSLNLFFTLILIQMNLIFRFKSIPQSFIVPNPRLHYLASSYIIYRICLQLYAAITIFCFFPSFPVTTLLPDLSISSFRLEYLNYECLLLSTKPNPYQPDK